MPGATFTSLDRDGKATEVDCREVRCGVITIGAHGVKNANNETFTPIAFRDLYTDDAGASGTPTPEPTEGAGASAAPTPAPVQTTVIVEEIPAAAPPIAAAPASDTDSLLSVLLWAIAGVGALTVAAVVFLVWAVLSARRRPVLAAPTTASADAATTPTGER